MDLTCIPVPLAVPNWFPTHRRSNAPASARAPRAARGYTAQRREHPPSRRNRPKGRGFLFLVSAHRFRLSRRPDWNRDPFITSSEGIRAAVSVNRVASGKREVDMAPSVVYKRPTSVGRCWCRSKH